MDTKPLNTKILRRMKYLSDQRGIMNRYLAEGDNWEPHLQQTREILSGHGFSRESYQQRRGDDFREKPYLLQGSSRAEAGRMELEI